jgi:hypothetical protein
MACYSMEDYQLRFNMGMDSFVLEVVDEEDEVVDSFDLMASGNCITVGVDDGDYVIGTGETIINDEEPHKYQVGGSNSQTFTDSTFTGIGIMDLRDMGRSGNLTTTYDLTCTGTLRIDGKTGQYPLWIKVPNLECVDVQPPL